MNGADALLDTLLANGVSVCFANPGTSEMQFVSALDRRPAMRSVLCLFEGVATGAADGFGRMAKAPACTLLHLGPGYGNGIANLHNARRAFTPIVNVVGDHATYHRKYDAPLNSDIQTLVGPNSIWARSADTADSVGRLTAEAIAASYGPPGGPVALLLPADAAWTQTSTSPVKTSAPPRSATPADRVSDTAKMIRSARKPALLIGGDACLAEGLREAGRISARGIPVFCDTFVARQPRGATVFSPKRMPYYAETALAELEGVDLLVLAGTAAPVAFFAYPDRPSDLVPSGCRVEVLASRSENAIQALQELGDALEAPVSEQGNAFDVSQEPRGVASTAACGASIARHLPEGAIICDDSVTSGAAINAACLTAAPHEVLGLTGGAIGIAMPMAIGAAIASPGRKVIALSGDGSAMYTPQALWTMAREALDITVVVFANRSYRILHMEMKRTGAGGAGPAAKQLLDLGNPVIDWAGLAKGMGVSAFRCETAEQFDAAFESAMRESGPKLIEVSL